MCLFEKARVRIKNVHGEYTTLNYSDHAIFLTIHMVKHFIGVGINLRMMLDVALYISTYRTQIDFDRFWYIMQQLHFDCVVNCVLTMMVQTGCFDWSEFPGGKVSSDDELAVFFDDLIATASDSWDHRKDSAYYEYSKAVMHQFHGALEILRIHDQMDFPKCEVTGMACERAALCAVWYRKTAPVFNSVASFAKDS